MTSLKWIVPCVFLSLVCMNSDTFASTPPQQSLDAYAQAWASMDMFSGTVLVVKDGKILIHKASPKPTITCILLCYAHSKQKWDERCATTN